MNNTYYINKVNSRFKRTSTEKCLKCPYFWLQYNSLKYAYNTQNFFGQYTLLDLGIKVNYGIYVGSYDVLESKLINYCRNTYTLISPIQTVDNLKVEYLSSSDDYYVRKVKEVLKHALDVAAQATERDNPEISIVFDGMGLILADDLTEAVDKVISMLDTAEKAMKEKCNERRLPQ